MGVYKIVVEIPKGWGGGYFSGREMEIPGGGGGSREIPSVVGVWIFLWNYTMEKKHFNLRFESHSPFALQSEVKPDPRATR